VIVINCTDNNEFLVGTYTFPAHDTFGEVPDDKGICLFETGVMGHGIELSLPHSQFSSNLPQLATVSFAADQAGFRMFRHHQADDVASVIDYAGGISPNDHILDNRGDTGGHETPSFFVFHQTESTGTGRFEVGVIAKTGNLYPVLLGCLQDCGSGTAAHILAVNGEGDVFQMTDSFPFRAPPYSTEKQTAGYGSETLLPPAEKRAACK